MSENFPSSLRRAARYSATRSAPDEKKQRPGFFWTGKGFFAFRPNQAGALGDSEHEHNRPGHHGQQEHRQVEPERLPVVVDILREAGEIVFENEDAKKFRIAQLDRDVPGQHDGEVEGDAREPQRTNDGAPVAFYSDEENDDDCGQGGCDRALCQRAQPQKDVKSGKIGAPAALVPRVPGEQGDGKAGGERHVGCGGMGKSDDSSATGSDECAVELATRAKSPEERINDCDQHGGVETGRHASRLIGHARGHAERQHRLPVIQHRLFEPRFALQGGRNPIRAIEHFARNLCVARFVGAEQSECPQSIEEKESAKRRQQQHIGAGSWIRSWIHWLHSLVRG
jgi:hypothetical protein